MKRENYDKEKTKNTFPTTLFFFFFSVSTILLPTLLHHPSKLFSRVGNGDCGQTARSAKASHHLWAAAERATAWDMSRSFHLLPLAQHGGWAPRRGVKLRSIWNSERELDLWCQALVCLKQEQAPEIPQWEGDAVSIPQKTQGRRCKDVKKWKQVQAWGCRWNLLLPISPYQVALRNKYAAL